MCLCRHFCWQWQSFHHGINCCFLAIMSAIFEIFCKLPNFLRHLLSLNSFVSPWIKFLLIKPKLSRSQWSKHYGRQSRQKM